MRAWLAVTAVGAMFTALVVLVGAKGLASPAAGRPGLEAGPAYGAPVDRTSEQLEAIARGCAAAGHQVDAGVQEGVWLVRCRPAGRPAHLESLGVVPVVAGRR